MEMRFRIELMESAPTRKAVDRLLSCRGKGPDYAGEPALGGSLLLDITESHRRWCSGCLTLPAGGRSHVSGR